MFLIWLIVGLILAYCARNIAIKKGRSHVGWFWITFFIPPAILLLMTLDDSEEKIKEAEKQKVQAIEKEQRKCPYCAEYIKKEAKVCKHCGRDIAEASEITIR